MTIEAPGLVAFGLLLPIVGAIAGLIAGRYGARQWKDTAEAREERIHDLEADTVRYKAKLEEKDKTIQRLVAQQAEAQAAIDRVGGAKVYELLVTQAAAQAERWEDGIAVLQKVADQLATHEEHEDERFAKTIRALEALTQRIENGNGRSK